MGVDDGRARVALLGFRAAKPTGACSGAAHASHDCIQQDPRFRAWLIKEELRDLYRLAPGRRPDAHLDGWLARASRSRIPAVVDLSRTIRKHRDQILAAADLGLSNSKPKGLNSKIRLINHRGYGHHSAAATIAMIYLCCSGLTMTRPTRR
jgi:hypothetical protein